MYFAILRVDFGGTFIETDEEVKSHLMAYTTDIDVDYYIRGATELTRETIMGEKWIRWAYQNNGRGLAAKLLFSSGLVSRLFGAYYDSRLSKGKISSAIKELGIDVSEFADDVASYGSFNEFFYRKLKPECRPFDDSDAVFCSPADGRTLAFPKLDSDTLLPVKGCPISVRAFLGRDLDTFDNGAALMVRLCPADYHRYHFPCAGEIVDTWDVPGLYHSVNPIALASGTNVFCCNKRTITLIDTERFGKVAYIEIGAFGVGSINQTYSGNEVEKMAEKGYFKFGGSSLALLFEPGKICFSDDLIQNTAAGYETLVKVGETVGTVKD